ncbi:hypothetical protein ACO0LF_19045 [Undibacterium sp. Di27W]|uniref:hypothetical protein n=1 Tax=Undibacterium sp. Di27W TaxID=3413036 RepID=UPI003BF321D5
MNTSKREKRTFRNQPGSFWIGAGIVAGAFTTFLEWLMPFDSCSNLIERIGCPPPVWFLIITYLLIYLLIAWIAYKLDLGA